LRVLATDLEEPASLVCGMSYSARTPTLSAAFLRGRCDVVTSTRARARRSSRKLIADGVNVQPGPDALIYAQTTGHAPLARRTRRAGAAVREITELNQVLRFGPNMAGRVCSRPRPVATTAGACGC